MTAPYVLLLWLLEYKLICNTMDERLQCLKWQKPLRGNIEKMYVFRPEMKTDRDVAEVTGQAYTATGNNVLRLPTIKRRVRWTVGDVADRRCWQGWGYAGWSLNCYLIIFYLCRPSNQDRSKIIGRHIAVHIPVVHTNLTLSCVVGTNKIKMCLTCAAGQQHSSEANRTVMLGDNRTARFCRYGTIPKSIGDTGSVVYWHLRLNGRRIVSPLEEA